MENLFSELEMDVYKPLAEKMRPQSLDDFIGQEEVV